MRKTRTEKQEINLLEPITLPDTDPDDCFGKEYDPRDRDCSICADIEICGIKTQVELQKKKKEFENNNGPLLDQTDFKSVNWKKIEQKALEYEVNNEPLTFEELLDTIKTLANTKDEVAVLEYIRRTLPKSLKLSNGQVIAR
jgi:hypothetical protein